MLRSELKRSKKIIPILPQASEEQYVSLYASQSKVYPRAIAGYFKNWRWAMIWLTQCIFYLVPWLSWGNRQAVLFDITAHKFYLFGLVLFPQDLIYLAFILIISAMALFLFTAVAGRLWCGFSCPQSVYTEIFLWIERKVEGDRLARMRLDSQPIGVHKLSKKLSKHAIWISFSMWTGFTFLGYFSPIRDLMQHIVVFNLSGWETFWICFYGFATYGNAGFLREQVCKYMCPYARFQSAMFDDNTLIVAYDEQRGEPRSGRSRHVKAEAVGLGDCIDCKMCVQVCPVGIDIRDGLQYECISCGLCIDACNDIMDKMEYPRNLIRFSTKTDMEQPQLSTSILRKVLRPRVLIYSAILLVVSIGLVVSLAVRTPFKVDVVRDRGVMARFTSDGHIENVYRLQITNTTESAHDYKITVHGIEQLSVIGQSTVKVNPASEQMFPISLQLPDGKITSGTHPIRFTIKATDMHALVVEESMFYVPR
ncbi:cytochrome c oxidase accessory protein CcoG [Methylotenera sp. 1P/1]|uniref:cytochrome c oxidase accessory protein CcoG n=1 Tax=Methylotenera sp. 1P/1 TaxID=1131551 RepID=UPI00036A51D9|nr:cytochrome c oxidase accessory protein CcoG [Methylotenera sp. 1P/1]